jgi:hypothetical protein
MPTTYAIPNGSTAFAATTWTGNGASSVTVNNAVNGTSFQPDFVWVKNRTTAVSHSLYDSIRGAGANTELLSNSTLAEGASNQDQYGYLSAFGSTGFTGVNGSSSPNYYFNENGSGYVGWQWKAGGAAVTNTAGSITSQVSANTAAGFSVVTYTGTGANATVGHGLGVAPSMIITKPRNSADNWISWHTALGATGYIYLNLINASANGAQVWNSTLPTSSVFSLGTSSNANSSGQTQVAYCWAAVPGYSAFGSYTGNGSADGPFVYLGFRPRYVLLKRTDSAASWIILDSARATYNAILPQLYSDAATAEQNDPTGEDFTANGFKLRTTSAAQNASGGTFIYMAFAENPFKYANAR